MKSKRFEELVDVGLYVSLTRLHKVTDSNVGELVDYSKYRDSVWNFIDVMELHRLMRESEDPRELRAIALFLINSYWYDEKFTERLVLRISKGIFDVIFEIYLYRSPYTDEKLREHLYLSLTKMSRESMLESIMTLTILWGELDSTSIGSLLYQVVYKMRNTVPEDEVGTYKMAYKLISRRKTEDEDAIFSAFKRLTKKAPKESGTDAGALLQWHIGFLQQLKISYFLTDNKFSSDYYGKVKQCDLLDDHLRDQLSYVDREWSNGEREILEKIGFPRAVSCIKNSDDSRGILLTAENLALLSSLNAEQLVNTIAVIGEHRIGSFCTENAVLVNKLFKDNAKSTDGDLLGCYTRLRKAYPALIKKVTALENRAFNNWLFPDTASEYVKEHGFTKELAESFPVENAATNFDGKVVEAYLRYLAENDELKFVQIWDGPVEIGAEFLHLDRWLEEFQKHNAAIENTECDADDEYEEYEEYEMDAYLGRAWIKEKHPDLEWLLDSSDYYLRDCVKRLTTIDLTIRSAEQYKKFCDVVSHTYRIEVLNLRIPLEKIEVLPKYVLQQPKLLEKFPELIDLDFSDYEYKFSFSEYSKKEIDFFLATKGGIKRCYLEYKSEIIKLLKKDKDGLIKFMLDSSIPFDVITSIIDSEKLTEVLSILDAFSVSDSSSIRAALNLLNTDEPAFKRLADNDLLAEVHDFKALNQIRFDSLTDQQLIDFIHKGKVQPGIIYTGDIVDKILELSGFSYLISCGLYDEGDFADIGPDDLHDQQLYIFRRLQHALDEWSKILQIDNVGRLIKLLAYPINWTAELAQYDQVLTEHEIEEPLSSIVSQVFVYDDTIREEFASVKINPENYAKLFEAYEVTARLKRCCLLSYSGSMHKFYACAIANYVRGNLNEYTDIILKDSGKLDLLKNNPVRLLDLINAFIRNSKKATSDKRTCSETEHLTSVVCNLLDGSIFNVGSNYFRVILTKTGGKIQPVFISDEIPFDDSDLLKDTDDVIKLTAAPVFEDLSVIR